jgi:hypothetical protein
VPASRARARALFLLAIAATLVALGLYLVGRRP